MKHFYVAAAVAVSFALMWHGPAAQAQSETQVILKSLDGDAEITGELIEFDGLIYKLRTGLGEIQVNAMQVHCEGSACPDSMMFGAKFSIHGSNIMGTELVPALIEGYAERLDADLVREVSPNSHRQTLRLIHDNGREMAAIEIVASGSDTAFGSLINEQAAIGMSSRAIDEAEVSSMIAAGMPDPRESEYESVLAHDALVAIINPANNVRFLRLEQLANIVSGGITNWSEVGGRDMAITLYLNDDASGNIDALRSHVLAPYDMALNLFGQRYINNSELSAGVLADPGGLGITSSSHIEGNIALGIQADCGLISFPTTFAIKTEEYPLFRRLYLYHTPRRMHPHVFELLAYMISDEVQEKIDDAGFISRSIERTGFNQMGQRLVHAMTNQEPESSQAMQDMMRGLGTAERLSLTFHFRPGSTQLDTESAYQAGQFAQAIAHGAYDGREIVLVGFSDSSGEFEVNLGLSLRRAGAVLTAMQSVVGAGLLAEAPVVVEGYGEVTPVACNTTAEGRNANRRVEVWLRAKK